MNVLSFSIVPFVPIGCLFEARWALAHAGRDIVPSFFVERSDALSTRRDFCLFPAHFSLDVDVGEVLFFFLFFSRS